jgi:hypothetical protein
MLNRVLVVLTLNPVVSWRNLIMVVGETIELFVVFAMVIISIIIVILIQKATGGVDNEEE